MVVVAFGEVLGPPHEVSIRAHVVRLNGVKLFSAAPPRARPRRAAGRATTAKHELISSILGEFEAWRRAGGPDFAGAQLAQRLDREVARGSVLERFEVVTPGYAVLLVFADGSREQVVLRSLGDGPAPSPMERVRAFVDDLLAVLDAGGPVVLGEGYRVSLGRDDTDGRGARVLAAARSPAPRAARERGILAILGLPARASRRSR